MGRVFQTQSIDSLIENITAITESQCSLSVQDKVVLNDSLVRLHGLKRKKGKTYQQILREVVCVVALLTKYFVDDNADVE